MSLTLQCVQSYCSEMLYNPAMSMFHVNYIAQYHVIEISIFLVLLYITIYRKDLSSNKIYRKKKLHKRSDNSDSILSLRKPNVDDLKYGFRKLKSQMDFIYNNVHSQNASDIVDDSTSSNNNANSNVKSKNQLVQLLHNQDMLITIMSLLSIKDINAISSTSKLIYSIHSEFAWEQLWVYRYGDLWKSQLMTDVRYFMKAYSNHFAN
jgi:hypothetical protein